jgi:4'-phosphopantetheinyl transferase
MRTLTSTRWIVPPQQPELPHDEVHIWKVDLTRILALGPALDLTLAPEESRWAKQFSQGQARRRYLLSCAVRRDILAGYLNAEPSELEFRYGVHGKPELANHAIHFNVTHSHRLAVCAVSKSLQLGVDVERMQAGVEEEISGWFFSSRAIRFLESLPRPRRQRVFFQGWTRMEAYAKALGIGLTIDFENLEALLTASGPVFYGAGQPAASSEVCWLHDFQPRKGYVAALAVRGGECKVKYWKWQSKSVRPLQRLIS